MKSKLKRLVKSAIAKFVPSKSVQWGRFVFTGAFEDYGVLRAIATNSHERTFTTLFTQTIEAGMTVVDVGAHLGKYVLLGSDLVGVRGRVIACEPHPRTFRFLQQNVQQNTLTGAVKLYNLAISDQDGEATLHADLLQSDFTSLAAIRDAREVNSVTVPTARLGSLDSTIVPDVLKIDVEGAELLVLQGCASAIVSARQLGKRPTLFIEANSQALAAFGKSAEDLYEQVQALGFTKVRVIDESSGRLQAAEPRKTVCENWFCS